MNTFLLSTIIGLMLSAACLDAGAEGRKSLGEKLIEGAVTEVGARIMGIVLDLGSNSIKHAGAPRWQPGSAHPRYPNVIASATVGHWVPAPGYSWANPNEPNDWSVLSSTSPAAVVRANEAADLQRHTKSYKIVYGGADGVNLRSIPGGPEVLVTAFAAQSHVVAAHSPTPLPANGTEWVKITLRGWMVSHGQRHRFVSDIDGQNAFVSWDGNGNPSDNFVARRSEASLRGALLAKVYTGTALKKIATKDAEAYHWNQVEVVGWMAIRETIGKRRELLAEN